MSAFILKLIACITMLIDHTGYVFAAQLDTIAPWLSTGFRVVGRLAFPIFAMCIAEGAARTSSPKRYFGRMLLFALIAQIPYSLMLGLYTTSSHYSFVFQLFGVSFNLRLQFSVMITLFLGLVISSGIHEGKHWRAAAALMIAALIDRTIGMDYGLLGVLLIVGLYLTRGNKFQRLLVLLIFCLCQYYSPLISFAKALLGGGFDNSIPSGVLFFAATLASGLFMLLYNGRKGPSAKFFFYLFYPVHMIILVTIAYLS